MVLSGVDDFHKYSQSLLTKKLNAGNISMYSRSFMVTSQLYQGVIIIELQHVIYYITALSDRAMPYIIPVTQTTTQIFADLNI